MTGHTSWARYKFERAARMSAVERAAFETGQRISRERLDREVWLVEVEGWLQRALTAARLGNEVEPLAWPVRTFADLSSAALDEYPQIDSWFGPKPDLPGFEHVHTWEDLRREAHGRLMAEWERDWRESTDRMLYGRSLAKEDVKRYLARESRLVECQTCHSSGIDPASGEYHAEVQAIDPASLEPCPDCQFPTKPWRFDELDGYGRTPDDPHYGHEHP